MNVSSRYLSLGAACLLAVALVACDKNQASPSSTPAPAPSPTPSPTPTPTPTAFTVSGTVAETAPTTDRRVEGVTISTGDTSVVTDGSGRFTLANLAAGAYILRASRGGYSDGVLTLTLPADAGKELSFNLEPSLDRTTQERSGTISQDNSPCSGGSDPCRRYDFPAHHEDDVEMTLLWSSSDAVLKLEFRCGGEVVASQTEQSDNVSRQGEQWLALELTARTRKGTMCEVRALHLSGPDQTYVMVVSHPN